MNRNKEREALNELIFMKQLLNSVGALLQCTVNACGCRFYTFDRPDLDAIPSGLLRWWGWWDGGGGVLRLHCTVLWRSAEHDPGLNVTGISELCTMQTFGSANACGDQEMHQLILMLGEGKSQGG